MLGGLREYGRVPGSGPERTDWNPNKPMATARSIGHAATYGALGATAGAASSLIEYAAAQYYNGQLQGAADSLKAKQLDSVISTGSGWDWLWHGRSCCLQQMVIDDYSSTKFAADVALNGIQVSEPTEDCSDLIQAGGPPRISELVVRGDIPAEAKQYIKARFANGVRMI